MQSEAALAPGIARRLAKELAALETAAPEGVKVESSDQLSVVYAYLKGPSDTPFAGGVFKIRLVYGPEFPSAPPKGHFLTKIFHPNVASNGEICVNTLKRDWSPDLNMAHILLTIKSLLFQPNPESALNEEAGKLLLEDYEEYRERAAMWTSIHANGFKDIFPSSSEPLTDSTSESLNVPMSNSSASMKKITTATATAAVKKADAVKKSSLKRL